VVTKNGAQKLLKHGNIAIGGSRVLIALIVTRVSPEGSRFSEFSKNRDSTQAASRRGSTCSNIAMADDDIIELGDDGAFELPSPSHKASITPITLSDPDLAHDPLPSSPSSSSILESLSAGEFKCFLCDNVLDVIIKLDTSQDETIHSIEVTKDVLRLCTSSGSTLTIDLSEVGAEIKAPEKGTATQAAGFVCVRFPLSL